MDSPRPTRTHEPILLEVCVGSVADVAAADSAGADRVELCGGLELGGLTPSAGAVEGVLDSSRTPVVVMLRPRAGGFCYDRAEFAAMLRDADRSLELGAKGIVFGVLNRKGTIDASRTRELVLRAGSGDSVFHRAFDFVADWRASLDLLMELGCTRVLTSGGQASAAAGTAVLREMILHAAGKIEVMPGGGIRAANVAAIVQSTGCRQVHIGAGAASDDGSLPADTEIALADWRFFEGSAYRSVDRAVVGATIAALRGAAP